MTRSQSRHLAGVACLVARLDAWRRHDAALAAQRASLTLGPPDPSDDPHHDPAVLLPDPGGAWEVMAINARESVPGAASRLAGRTGVHPGPAEVVAEVVASWTPPPWPAKAGNAARRAELAHRHELMRETVAAVARRAVSTGHAGSCRGK